MKRILLIHAFSFFCLVLFPNTDISLLIREIKEEESNKEYYVKMKYRKVDSLRNVLLDKQYANNLHVQFDIYQDLFNEFRSFVYDSAFNYAVKAQKIAYKLNDDQKISLSKLNFGFILISSGLFKEAFDTLETLQSSVLPDTLLKDYYLLMGRAHLDLICYHSNWYYTAKYDKIKNRYIDSTVNVYHSDSNRYLYYYSIRFIENGAIRTAQTTLEELIHGHKMDDHLYAMASSSLAYVYQRAGETDKAISMLAEAVKADIRSSTKETMAALTLAELLYEEGYPKDAYFLIKLAMDDALFYNSNLRKKQISAILPIIEENRLITTENQKRLFIRYSLATTILAILVVIFLFITFKQLRQLVSAKRNISEINNKLMESNKIKDEYIGYYFNSNSEYIDRIEKFKKTILRKLLAGRINDIEMVINNINPYKEREDLFTGFDKVFLRLFPDFVEQFNALLKSEERIIINENEYLTTDLRIFALIRLGINDHRKISRILGYSLSTIYNYKTKLKKKALVLPDKFEEEVMKIKPV
ncbi:MAG: hypothetical protein JW894_15135 [Bacteroidales bacterium]|nr:hypothetical protein [Bacteroidales bacterium]